jgi:hypothetical protein
VSGDRVLLCSGVAAGKVVGVFVVSVMLLCVVVVVGGEVGVVATPIVVLIFIKKLSE